MKTCLNSLPLRRHTDEEQYISKQITRLGRFFQWQKELIMMKIIIFAFNDVKYGHLKNPVKGDVKKHFWSSQCKR